MRAAAETESKAAPDSVPSPSSYIRDQMISTQAPEAGIKAQGGQRGTREEGISPVPAYIYTTGPTGALSVVVACGSHVPTLQVDVKSRG